MIASLDNTVELTLDSRAHGGGAEFKALLLAGDGGLALGIVLLHGRNAHPDAVVVGPLRRTLYEQGYTTLSLSNPVPEAGDEFAHYVADVQGRNIVFREAFARIRAGLAELARHGVDRAILLGFSMGARLHSAFLAEEGDTAIPVIGFISLSNGVNGAGPLNSASTLSRVSVPVLDVYGTGDEDVARSADERKHAYLAGPGGDFRQVGIEGGAPHNFAGHEDALQRVLIEWTAGLAKAQKGKGDIATSAAEDLRR